MFSLKHLAAHSLGVVTSSLVCSHLLLDATKGHQGQNRTLAFLPSKYQDSLITPACCTETDVHHDKLTFRYWTSPIWTNTDVRLYTNFRTKFSSQFSNELNCHWVGLVPLNRDFWLHLSSQPSCLHGDLSRATCPPATTHCQAHPGTTVNKEHVGTWQHRHTCRKKSGLKVSLSLILPTLHHLAFHLHLSLGKYFILLGTTWFCSVSGCSRKWTPVH